MLCAYTAQAPHPVPPRPPLIRTATFCNGKAPRGSLLCRCGRQHTAAATLLKRQPLRLGRLRGPALFRPQLSRNTQPALGRASPVSRSPDSDLWPRTSDRLQREAALETPGSRARSLLTAQRRAPRPHTRLLPATGSLPAPKGRDLHLRLRAQTVLPPRRSQPASTLHCPCPLLAGFKFPRPRPAIGQFEP